MATSVNADQQVNALDATDSSADTKGWLTTLTRAIAEGKTESTENLEVDEAGGSGAPGDTGDMDLSVNQIRDKYEIPDFSEDGLMDVTVGDDSTVGTQAAENFIDGIRDDIDSGKLSEDSDEAKLVDLIDAQGAVDNGYDLYGYVELIESGGSTYRQTQTNPTHLTGDDAKAIIDEDALAKQISDLMQKESISKRYDSALQDSIASIPDDKRTAIADKVDEALFEPDSKDPNLDFENYVIATKEKAEASGDEELSDKIQTEVDNYFEALQALEPDNYAQRKQTFDQNMMTHQLDTYMENPDSIDADNAKVALRDTIDIVQHGINGALQNFDKGTKAYNAYNKVLNDIESFKQTLGGLSSGDSKKLVKSFNLAINISESSGTDKAQKEKLFQNVINDNLKDVSEDTRGTFKKLLDSSSSSGMLGAMTGTMSLISGGVQLANGSWDDMTGTERLAAVRDLVSGLSYGNDFARFGSNIVEQLAGKKEGQARIQATSWLGLLDENFPDIWKSQSTQNADAVSKQIKDSVNTASENLGDAEIPLDNLDENGRRDYREMIQALGEQMGAPSTGDSKGDTARKAGRSFLRFMGGAGLDVTGGVMDIVTGVNKLKNADSALERAGAGLTLAAGTSGTAMSIANTISMFSSRGSNLAASIGNIGSKVINGLFMGSRIAGPVLGIAGAIFGVAGSLIAEAINHQKLQKLTDSQGDFFKDLSEYGVTQDDWGDKLEFARYESYMYGGRDTPDDRSIFDYQSKEWQHFQDTEGKRGSSLPRLSPYLHKDGDPGTENLWEKHLTGGTTRQTGKDHTSKTDDWRPWSDTDMDAGDEGLGTDELRRNSRMDAMMTLYGKDFFDAHHAEIDTIATVWDDWNGGDSIVSRDDLRDIVADEGRSQSERDAAQFLLDENGFYDGLDSLKHGGDGDAKISTNDLDTWLGELGKDSVDAYRQTAAANDYDLEFLQDHSAELQTIAERWNDWNGKDDIVSRKDLQKIVDDDEKSESESAAADFLLENEGFFNTLDTFQKGGDGDNKISTKDFDDWFATIGEDDLDGYRQSSIVGDHSSDFYHANQDALKSVIELWDDWNGKDDIVSRKDLNKIADDEDRSDSERDAAKLLLGDDGLFTMLDTFKKNDGSDDKISTKDLNAWLETIGVERRA
ncbi:hypothetical protein ACUN9V_12255 [Salinicola sp. V024]|uniref:hypothetical protein n=1 Tax=Salinicola sp. V024 TaxID=3459609 RepID=UPI00404448F0